jgi:glycosyltransferase involved in cell wall biosynthesis
MGLLDQVIGSIAGQTEKSFRVLLVDSASPKAIPESVLRPLHDAHIEARLVREEIPGIARARLRTISETSSDWILFCDDDNVLTENFVAEGIAFIRENPGVGCFGGKLLLPEEIRYPKWASPFLPYLAIKDLGEKPRGGIATEWREWEPPGAGVFVCRQVLQRFSEFVGQSPEALDLGRSGQSLSSGEDSLLMRCAYLINRATAYNPKMVLYHHLDPSRFRFEYLFRLMKGYGHSYVLLEKVLQNKEIPREYASYLNLLATFIYIIRRNAPSSWRFALAMLGYHASAYHAYRRLYSGVKVT